MKAYSIVLSEDTARLMSYLTSRGVLYISPKQVEELYKTYSQEVYSAGWMELDEGRLGEFATWLSKREI